MEKEKLLKLMAGFLVIVVLSFLLPRLITLVSERIVHQILKNSESEVIPETNVEKEQISLTLPTQEEWMPYADGSEEEPVPALIEQNEGGQKEKEDYDKRLTDYRNMVKPEYVEHSRQTIETFVGERSEKLNAAVADHLFSLYEDTYEVERIEFWELVRDNETEISYQIEVFVNAKKEAYSELFICSYNKVLDYYSLYGCL